MKLGIYTIVFFFFLHLTSCFYEQTLLPEDSVMEELLQTNTDSLAFLLEEEIDPRELSDEDKTNYIWWLTNTHKKQYRSLVNDSLIHKVLTHYKETESPRLLETYLLAAEQAFSIANTQLHESITSEALDVALEQKNLDLLFELLHHYRNMDIKSDNEERTSRLIAFLKENINSENEVDIYFQLTRLLIRSHQRDSLDKYLKLGIDVAIRQNKPAQEYIFTRFYSDALLQSGQADKALAALDTIVKKMPVGQSVVGNEISFNYIIAYTVLGKYDSARVHINNMYELIDMHAAMIEPIERYLFKSLIQQFELIIKVKQGKPFSTKDIYLVDNILNIIRAKDKADKEKLFAQSKLQRDKLTLEIEKNKMQQRVLWGVIFALMALVALVTAYQRKLLKKERYLQKAKEQLRAKSIEISTNETVINKNKDLIQSLLSQIDQGEDLKEDIQQLEKENETLKDKNQLLQKDIESFSSRSPEKDKELVFYENLSLENAKLLKREQFLSAQLISKTDELRVLNEKPSFINEPEWYEIIHIIDQVFDGFSVRLHIDYPNLTEDDIRFCCLFKLNLSHSTISTLMGISPSSVTKRKQRIKEKMAQHSPNNMKSNRPLETFLWN